MCSSSSSSSSTGHRSAQHSMCSVLHHHQHRPALRGGCRAPGAADEADRAVLRACVRAAPLLHPTKGPICPLRCRSMSSRRGQCPAGRPAMHLFGESFQSSRLSSRPPTTACRHHCDCLETTKRREHFPPSPLMKYLYQSNSRRPRTHARTRAQCSLNTGSAVHGWQGRADDNLSEWTGTLLDAHKTGDLAREINSVMVRRMKTKCVSDGTRVTLGLLLDGRGRALDYFARGPSSLPPPGRSQDTSRDPTAYCYNVALTILWAT